MRSGAPAKAPVRGREASAGGYRDVATSDDARRGARVHAGNGSQTCQARTRAARHGRRTTAESGKAAVPLQPLCLLDAKAAFGTSRVRELARSSETALNCRTFIRILLSHAEPDPIQGRVQRLAPVSSASQGAMRPHVR